MALSDTAKLIASLELQDKFSRPVAGINKSLGGLERNFSRIGRGAGQVASGLSQIGTRAALAAAAGLGAVVTTAASFEQAFTGVEKTVDGTDAQLKELEGTLRQMARTIPVSFEELAGIGEAGGALGIARESLDEFVDVVARLSVSTNLSSEQAATALGQLGTILHLSGDDFEDFADSLVALGNAGASTEDQIIDMAARFAAAGNSAGLTKEEILALASATASMGIEVEAGGTALSQTFNNIATGIGTGSDEIKAFTKTLGISAAEFKRRWTEDALGTFQDFLAELSKLDQFEQADVLTRAGITGVRQLSAIKLMTQNVGFLSDQLEISKNATGALDKESQKFFDTTTGRWKVLQNNVRDAAATIGSELLPIANDLITDFVGFLGKPGTQSAIAQFGKDLADGVRGLVKELKGTDFSGVLSGMKLAAQVAKGAFDAFRSLPEPIQQLAIAALVANKVSGGAVGSIAKGLANILIGTGGIFARGASPANPLWVQSVAGGVGGGTVVTGGVGGAGLVISKFLGAATVVAVGAKIGEAIAREWFFNQTVQPAIDFETGVFKTKTEGGSVVLADRIEKVEAGIKDLNESLPGGLAQVFLGPELETLNNQKKVLEKQLAHAVRVESADAARWTGLANSLRGTEASSRRLEGLAARELAKPTTVNVSVNTSVSVSRLASGLQSFRIAGQGSIGGFTESAF